MREVPDYWRIADDVIADVRGKKLKPGDKLPSIAELRDRYDLVIIDSPPVLPVTDPLIIARHVDGVVAVVRCESTTRTELQRAMTLLRQGDTNILGVILNEVDARQERYDYNSEYYTYRAADPGTEPARC